MHRWSSLLVVTLLGALAGFLARPILSPLGEPRPSVAEPGDTAKVGIARTDAPAVVVGTDELTRAPGLLLDSATADLTGDGRPERIELFAAVERDSRGRLMWDDGQAWMLVVHRGGRKYPLLDRLVQLGHVRFWAIEQSGDGPSLLVQVATGSGVEMEAYAYDAAREAFIRTHHLRSGGNVVHVTPHTAF